MVDFLIGQYRGALQTEDHDANDLDDVEIHSPMRSGSRLMERIVGIHHRAFQRSPNMGCSEERVLVPPSLSWVCSVRTI